MANRRQAETEGLIGFFVNQLVMRTKWEDNPSVREYLRRVRGVVLGAYEHQDVPFEKLVEELEPERDAEPHAAVPGEAGVAEHAGRGVEAGRVDGDGRIWERAEQTSSICTLD